MSKKVKFPLIGLSLDCNNECTYGNEGTDLLSPVVQRRQPVPPDDAVDLVVDFLLSVRM